jgi:hypothetical protein
MSVETECAHEGCTCEVDINAVEVDGKKYCSRACSEGKSCEHPGCHC